MRRERPPTLRGRVSLVAIAVLAGWLILLGTGLVFVLVNRLNSQVDDELRVRAQAASTTVDIARTGGVTVRESATDSELDSSIWVFAHGRALRRPHLPEQVQRAAKRESHSSGGYLDAVGQRFYALPLTSGGTRVGTVVAAIDRGPFDRTREIIVVASVALMVLLLAGVYPVLRLAAGRALRPVNRMSTQAAKWGVSAPGQRFGRQRFHELDSLAGNLDELLDRLAAVLRHERHVSAELSHELRTPLSRVTAQLDLLRDGARPDQLAEIDALAANCASMEAIMDALLAAARSDFAAPVGRCDVAELLAEYAGSADDDPITVRVQAPAGLTVGVAPELVRRMLAPVLDNAHRYARSRISLRAMPRAGGVGIDVANDGPPLSDRDASRVFEPGFRGADVPDDLPGAGLGLALARRLAQAADGDLTASPDATGTTFQLALPSG